jgi:hypothetical protein
VTKTEPIHARAAARALALLTAFVAAGLVLAPGARPGAQSIAAYPANPTTITGVFFTVSTGGGNRDYASVEVSCTSGGVVVYGTVLTVIVEPKSTGTSQTIYPPASDCVANLTKQMSIGKSRVLASVNFAVTQA